MNGRNDDIGKKARTVFAYPPAFFLEASLYGGGTQFRVGMAGRNGLRQIKK